MRFEAKHQGVKRKCKSMGFRNVLETVPKIMNESRKADVSKLSEITIQGITKPNSFILGKHGNNKAFYKICQVNELNYETRCLECVFDERLLAYKILKISEPVSIEKQSLCLLSEGLYTKFLKEEYIFFF